MHDKLFEMALTKDAEVGVKWTWKRGRAASQRLIASVLCVP